MPNILGKRFEELTQQAIEIEARSRIGTAQAHEQLDYDLVLNWKVKAKSLLINVCGITSVQVNEFTIAETFSVHSNVTNFRKMKAVFAAAKEDYDGGYLSSIRTLVQAEVFSSELDQATELLAKGFQTAAAVVAGVVLETHLQELCRTNGVPPGKVEVMNAELVKKGAYNVLRQKQITAHADLRNKAAHGKSSEFTAADVKSMIGEVERFIAC